VEVYCYCAGSYLEDQDMWRLSGIFRNVTLWSAPNVHVRDFDIKTDMDSQYKDATLTVSAKVRNYGDISVGLNNLSMTLYDNMGNLVSPEISTGIPALEPGREQMVTLSMHVKDPDKWTAETPNLYTTVLVLSGSENKEIISALTGFRKIEIKGRLFTINGVPIKLKGVNRHENWPDTGHYVSEERMIHDLRMLKQGNCNHVRTCHYSDDPRWYELCDQWGIYLNAEANVECHGYYDVLDREPKYEKAIIDRNLANVENFKNHASVIMWSLGNENGGGRNFVSALNAVKSLDTTRPIHYEPFGIDKNNPADVDSRMYSSVEEVEKFANSASQTKPFYLCEYAHAMFNSMGALAEYNELFDKYPSLMGGAIWEWHDQGLWNMRNPERMYLAFGGGFGDRPNDHYYIHKGVVFADRSPKPHYPEMKRLYQWIGIEPVDLVSGKIKIYNKYAFTRLDNFNGQWTISEDGIMIHGGKFEPFDLAPGCEKILVASFPQITPRPNAEYFLQIEFTLKEDQLWARSGHVVAQAQFKLPLETQAAAANIEKIKPLELREDDKKITIKNNEYKVIFSKTEGAISQLVSNNINILAVDGGPEIHLWRAPHQNDDLWAYEEWCKHGLDKMKFSTIYVTASMPQPYVVRIEARIRAQGENNFSVIHTAVYTIYGDGTIVVDNSIAPSGPRIPLARMGVRFLLNSKLDQLTYLGRGPMENYADRKQGSDIGLYSSSIFEQMTPYAKPMECGNHEDVRWAAVTGKNMPALMVQANGNYFQVSALPYTDEVMTPVEYAIDLPPSISTVLVLASQTLGVGSRSCGPRPLEQYIVWPDPVVFSYILRILPIGENDLLTAGRTAIP